MHNNLNGYFIGDIESPNNLKIKDDTLEVACINGGDIYVRFATKNGLKDENDISVFSYSNVEPSTGLLKPTDYYDYLKEILL